MNTHNLGAVCLLAKVSQLGPKASKSISQSINLFSNIKMLGTILLPANEPCQLTITVVVIFVVVVAAAAFPTTTTTATCANSYCNLTSNDINLQQARKTQVFIKKKFLGFYRFSKGFLDFTVQLN